MFYCPEGEGLKNLAQGFDLEEIANCGMRNWDNGSSRSGQELLAAGKNRGSRHHVAH
jgi:hypothetical protein